MKLSRCGALSMSWATIRAVFCWSNRSKETGSTSTALRRIARWCSPPSLPIGRRSEGTEPGELLPVARKLGSKAEIERLRRASAELLSSMRMARGVTHTEFLRSHATGEFYFMETSASVDNRCVADMMQETHGLNLWREWAKLEVAAVRGQRYALPSTASARKTLPSSTDGQHRLA